MAMSAKVNKTLRGLGVSFLAILLLGAPAPKAASVGGADEEHHLLYVVAPGIRDYLQFGGAGIIVFDMDHGHRFVKRIETPASREPKPENINGVCANAVTQRLYFTTLTKLYCFDL